MHILQVRPALSALSNLVVAIATIHRSTIGRFKWYLSVFATIGALYRKHLAPGPVAVASIPVAAAVVSVLPCFPCLAACGAALRLVGIAS
jgi:hypothetical protein